MRKVIMGFKHSDKRGTCPFCQREIRLTLKGDFVRHVGADKQVCPGAGQIPANAEYIKSKSTPAARDSREE